jgi:hypothetical protein
MFFKWIPNILDIFDRIFHLEPLGIYIEGARWIFLCRGHL